MQTKYKIIIVIIVVILFLATFPLFINYGSGDIGGQKVLQHPFMMVKPLCFLVGGRFKTEVSGWGGSDMGYCLVKNKLICTLRGGKILTKAMMTDDFFSVEPVGSCIKK